MYIRLYYIKITKMEYSNSNGRLVVFSVLLLSVIYVKNFSKKGYIIN